MKRVLVFLIFFGLWSPPSAFALGRDERTIATSGLYGILAGTGMGLIALPSTQSGKSVLMGASIGLYLGLVVGVYHIYHRDDPGNPLSPYSQSESQGATQLASAPALTPSSAPLRVDVQVYAF